MAGILDRLRGDHVNFERVLARLDVETKRLFPKMGDNADFPLILGMLHYLHTYADRRHHPCEDALYSHLLERGNADIVVGDVLRQHRKLKHLSAKLCQLVDTLQSEQVVPIDFLATRLDEFTSLQRRHLTFENRYLFPFAERQLTPNEWYAVERSAPLPEDPVFGTGADSEQRLFGHKKASSNVFEPGFDVHGDIVYAELRRDRVLDGVGDFV
jgi:hemerythrin-like domain-containing protein